MMINKILKLKSIFSVTKFTAGSPYLKQYFTKNPIKLVPQVMKANQIEDNFNNIVIKIQSQNERVLPRLAPSFSQSRPDLFLKQSKSQNLTTSSSRIYYKHGNIHKYFSSSTNPDLNESKLMNLERIQQLKDWINN